MSDDIKAVAATVPAPYKPPFEAPPLRELGKTVSEPIVSGLVAILDATVILGTGVLSLEWSTSSADWRLLGLVVLLVRRLR